MRSSLFFLQIRDRLNEPFKSFRKPFSGHCRASLNVVWSVLNLIEFESLHHLLSFEGKLQILLVCKHENGHFGEKWLFKEGLQFPSALTESDVVSTVYHVHESVCVFVVIPPVRTDLPLPTDVPHVQLETVLCLNNASEYNQLTSDLILKP